MREAGRTDIARSAAGLLAVAFAAVIIAVPVGQLAREGRAGRGLPPSLGAVRLPLAAASAFRAAEGSGGARIRAANRALLFAMHQYEAALEDDAWLGHLLRPWIQYGLVRWLGAGNEKAYCGERPWLFYRPDVDTLTGPGFLDPVQLARRAESGEAWEPAPQPDPRPAILDFHRQLAARGIRLVLVPVPPKPALQPDKLSPRFAPGAAPLANRSEPAWRAELERAGVIVADLAPALAAPAPEPPALAADTHWRPESMQRAARLVRGLIEQRALLPPRAPAGYRASADRAVQRGDLIALLQLPTGQRGYPAESVPLRRIAAPRGGDWRADDRADVLVLGDSFCNIYSLAAMGWGESAGFVEQLSYELQRPLDRITVNDRGAGATRRLLARELERGRDRLAGKRLVIWVFAARELTHGDWPLVPLALRPAPSAAFLDPAPGRPLVVSGQVRAVAPVPRPGSVPYADHLTAVHLVDAEAESGAGPVGQALVYLESMRSNAWTDAARLRSGDRVRLRLQAWADMGGDADGINRSDLPDEALLGAAPCWGVLLPPPGRR